MPSIINSTTTSPGGLISTGASDNSLLIQTGDTTAITISSTQQVTLTNPLPAASGGTGLTSFPSPGTAGNVLTSNGTAWTSAAAAAFDAGTVMLFAQTAAPTGWTKLTNLDNYALRVVSGTASTGGSVAFTTAFASQTPSGSVSINTSGLSAGATTLSTAQMPSHNHSLTMYASGCFSGTPNGNGGSSGSYGAGTSNTGGGGSHTHSISGSATGSFTGTAINLAVQYVDVIRASKN
jgi:hypothetical protein